MKNRSETGSLEKKLGGRNLYLIGMMGSGKSTTGVPLAKIMNYKFIDLDDVIEQSAKKTISNIFKEDGEDLFRGLEHQVLNEVGHHHSLVVATGGGVVTRSDNWGILHQGIVIWLQPSNKELLKRLSQDKSKRPLLDGINPEASLEKLIQEREAFYAEADLQVVVQDESPVEVAKKIIKTLPSILTNPEDQFSPQTTAN